MEQVPRKPPEGAWGISILGGVQKLCEQGPEQPGLALEIPCCEQGLGPETSGDPFTPDFFLWVGVLCC